MSFKNKNILVIGAASGIGAACANLYAEEGATIVLADLAFEKGKKVLAQLKQKKANAYFIMADVSNFDSIKNLYEEAINHLGNIDVVVNSAGIANTKLLKTAEHSLEEWDRIIDVNQKGMFYSMKMALKHMMSVGKGNIVNVASLAGLIPSGRNIAYSASKFAVVGMTKSAALEYAKNKIRINAVCPSYTNSSLLEGLFNENPELENRLLKMIPMNRFAESDEIAQAIHWLSSDKSAYITGQALVIDGGLSLK